MPFRTDRGVTSYSDRDTPAEYATSGDEERARYNEAIDSLSEIAAVLPDELDNISSPPTSESETHKNATIIQALASVVCLVTMTARVMSGENNKRPFYLTSLPPEPLNDGDLFYLAPANPDNWDDPWLHPVEPNFVDPLIIKAIKEGTAKMVRYDAKGQRLTTENVELSLF